ncbi:caspase family protein [Leptospira mayottensis]|uniref:Caspase domain protein n=2 Tax=Leptospira mayottensis TaxID=1137606 RepID=A0AA87SVB8_9LEPT|nr:caspase family protein [Leptospira mayottensis]AXR66609.1 caspase family protein [Leptospira mayottensis]AZQ04250.1 caspase [Leptospira mayottensis 200901116]EKR98786.1 caspase domain protein [Leptospira mayottensis 200901122]TGN14478.1 caspase family protein [Leptospira mayottensis]
MKRICLLIGAPGSDTKGNYLNGVSVDMERMRQYLYSNVGGAWYPNEIEQVVNPSKHKLLSLLNKIKYSDYSLILFSGHGGTSIKNGKTYIEINSDGDDFEAEGLINYTDREVVIIDSCRSYFTPPTSLQGDTYYKSLINEQTNLALKHRRFYDEQVLAADPGSLILYACSIGETANDTNEGGIFTQNLISTGNNINNYKDRNIFQELNYTFNTAKNLVSQRFRTQHPTMEGSIKRNTWFPFAVKV